MTRTQSWGRGSAVRPGGAAALSVIAAVLLTGCAGPSSPPTGAPSTPTASPSATPSASSSAPPATPTATAGPGACGPDQLTLALQSRGQDSGAGNFFWDLSLTNDGPTACTVEGYPVTTLVSGASGEPVGTASGTEPGRWYTVTVVTLAPGTSAYSLLHLGQAGAYDCPLVPVSALDVTLPGWETASRVDTPNPIEGCDDDSTVIVRTGPLAPAPVTF